MSLNLVLVRVSNGDSVKTVIVGSQARAFVAPDTESPPAAANGKKSPRPPIRQPVDLRPTRCYASSVCRGYYHGKKK